MRHLAAYGQIKRVARQQLQLPTGLGTPMHLGVLTPKPVLAEGTITNTDALVIVLSGPDNQPAAVLIPLASSGVCGCAGSLPGTVARSPRSWPGCRTAGTAQGKAVTDSVAPTCQHGAGRSSDNRSLLLLTTQAQCNRLGRSVFLETNVGAS
jgi:hypothetical protein